MKLTDVAFKAYDVRGIYPTEVNEELAYRVGRVFAKKLSAKKVVLGHDIRLSGKSLVKSLAEGLTDGGADVIFIGQCGTEMVYFATTFLQADGGIMVTASHNPKEYNGMKLVSRGARPISADTGLKEIGKEATQTEFLHKTADGVTKGKFFEQNITNDYISHLLTFVDVKKFKPLHLVVNSGNGGAGPIFKELAKHLPVRYEILYEEPDGNFPNGVPNPLLFANRKETAQKVCEMQADLGISWDGDFDRCFLYDEKGNFIEASYIVGLLAEVFLAKEPGAKIMYDPRVRWNTEEIVNRLSGKKVLYKSGHAFMKECMRREGVVYGGESSAHHYFRDFTCCDSGMLPWLLVAEHLSVTGKKLSELVGERMKMFPCSGEINRKVADAPLILQNLEKKYGDGEIAHVDGLSVAFANWRFNVRTSNTEPVMRLNVETRGDTELLKVKTQELLAEIGGEEA